MPRRNGTKADPPETKTECALRHGAVNDPQPAPASRREELISAITQEEARLSRLEAEQAESRHRLGALQAELASLEVEPEIRVRMPPAGETPVPRTSAEKVELFRSFFRGREDVFPTRFVSKKTGKAGYAPACRNKFVRGVCELPKIKCGSSWTMFSRHSSKAVRPSCSRS